MFAHTHELHPLVLDEPGGLVANCQVAHQFQRGDVVLEVSRRMARNRRVGGRLVAPKSCRR